MCNNLIMREQCWVLAGADIYTESDRSMIERRRSTRVFHLEHASIARTELCYINVHILYMLCYICGWSEYG